MTNPLRDYQMEGITRAYHAVSAYGGFYFQHDPGMGKTLSLIVLARLLKIHRICVACPPVALGVWQREMRKWWPRFAVEDARNDLRCISYDSLSDPTPADPSKPKRQTGRTRLIELQDWRPELLVLDEAQYVKSPSANRTKAVWALSGASIYTVALSGTPMHNVLDLWAQYRMIARDEPLFKQSFTDYKKQMVVLGGPTGNWPMKDKKTGELKFKPYARELVARATDSYTHTATSDLMQLDEPVFTEVPFELHPTERKAYTEMESVLRADLPDGSEVQAEIVLTKLLRLSQISAGHTTNTAGKTVDIYTSRLDACMGLLELRENQQVVIACRFKRDIEMLRDRLNAQGRPVAIIWGETPANYRTQYEDWFQSGKAPNGVMLLQYQAGGVAITLHAARTLILYTLDYSVIRYKQMIGRVWRLGQKSSVEVLTLLAEDTQDDIMNAGLRRGVENADMAKLLLNYLRRK